MVAEAAALRHQEAKNFAADLPTHQSAPLRLLHMLYEKSNWNPDCRQARTLLNGLLRTLPDNKVYRKPTLVHHRPVSPATVGGAGGILPICFDQEQGRGAGVGERGGC